MLRTAVLVLALTTGSLGHAAPPPMQTVAAVDLERYAGKWYEIASMPMFFQRNCVGDTTAEYTVRPDNTVGVNNRCRTKDGSIDSVSGTATPVPGSNNAKLEVTFFSPIKGDYWIIGLDPEYRWAVVGAPSRKVLWILSRSPQLHKEDLNRAMASATAQGYTLEDLRFTPQQ